MQPKVLSFVELLNSAKRSAVHLEMRDTYAVAEERSDVARWNAGRWTHEDGKRSLAGWLSMVEETVGRGVTLRRARIVSEPVTDYIRFEHFTTPLNIEAGEEVRWLPRRQAIGIALPAVDFWLIDESVVRFNHFSGSGDAVEPEITEDPSVAALCASAFEAVWERALPHENYVI
ncbi:hypothetical protein QR77_25710 [Streptomyces sp. 150FB]|jgi:hypothetical protein|uniref:DUF6879 family protein n=1 Tax=Streptomyces sp. 150FB TaxID=1576605 RepID=UPI0005894589|nr:DUF6879 family protein [Streptomyces sp. 150FB]KIF76360.1 hypothetical protein QR77_25710 [Streptomyces sp. 150FB]